MMLWQPFHLKQCMTNTLPHHETEHQRSVNNIWSGILGNQGFPLINELITELLTAFIAKNTTYKRNNTYSKIINVVDCKTCKKRLFPVEYLILIIYNYSTAKTGILYKFTDGPTGKPADNPPNSDRLGDFHQTVLELTFRVYWHPGPPICQLFGSDPHLDPKWRSETVGNTICCLCDKFQHLVNKSGRLYDSKDIVSELNCSQDDFARWSKPSKSTFCFGLPAHLTYTAQNLRLTFPSSATA